jgi:uncharacterized protein YndB with AHSA1/START domain
MIDLVNQLNAVHRETGRSGAARTVVLRRTYDAAIADVWDAITSADRISRWFLPITGDLRPGGTYQLKGNAGGEIKRCDPPTLLRVTWTMGEGPEPSEVQVRLSPGGPDTTELELEHTAVVDEAFWGQFGPGAVGVGWDLALLGLGMHLRGDEIGDHSEFEQSDEARRFMTDSSSAWAAAYRAAGASAEEAAAAEQSTTNFYAPPGQHEQS